MSQANQRHLNQRHAIYQLTTTHIDELNAVIDLGFSHFRLPILYPFSLKAHQHLLTQIAKRSAGTQAILSINPYVMPTSTENTWWMDALKYGKQSAYYEVFDSDFSVAPIEHRLGFQAKQGFVIHQLPLAMRSYPSLLHEWIRSHDPYRGYIAYREIAELQRHISHIQSAILSRYSCGNELVTNIINWFSASRVRITSLQHFLKQRQDLVSELIKEQHYRINAHALNEVRIRLQDPKVFDIVFEPIKQLIHRHPIVSDVEITPNLRDPKPLILQLLGRDTPDVSGIQPKYIKSLLELRRQNPRLFTHGHRFKLPITGVLSRHFDAFYQTHKDQHILVVIPKLNAVRADLRQTHITIPPHLSKRWINISNQELILPRHGQIRASTFNINEPTILVPERA